MDEHVLRAEFDGLVHELHELRAQLDHERARRTPARRGSPSAPDAAAIAVVGDDVEAGAHRETALSRRGLLRRVAGAGALGAGLLVVGDTFAPRAAHAGTDGDVVLGASNDAGGNFTTLTSSNGNETLFVQNTGVGVGVRGLIGSGTTLTVPQAGVVGDAGSVAGVVGLSDSADGIRGLTKNNAHSGVFGQNVAGSASESALAAGVAGWSSAGTGVYGRSIGASGLGALATGVAGVVGDTNAFEATGVAGLNSNTFGRGLYGLLFQSTNVNEPAGVVGDSTIRTGVFGSSMEAVGVFGYSRFDAGVRAQGGRANLALTPLAFTGLPTTGAYLVGDVYVDAIGAIYQCVANGDFSTSTHPVFMRIGFNPLTPVRLCETFAGSRPSDGFPFNAYTGQTIAAGGTLTVTLAGTLAPPVNQPSPVPVQASAVVFILEAQSSGAGGLTIYPADVTTAPTALSILFKANDRASGEVTAKLGVATSAGKIKIFNRANTPTDVILDVTGFYS